MPRQLVTQEQLLELRNQALATHDECDGCKFTAIQAHEQDPEGCNWTAPWLTCSGTPAAVCKPVADHVVGELRKQYNLG